MAVYDTLLLYCGSCIHTGKFDEMVSYVKRLMIEHRVLVVDERHIGGPASSICVPLQDYVGQQQVVVAEHNRISSFLQCRLYGFYIGPQTFDSSGKCLMEPARKQHITHNVFDNMTQL